MQSVRFNGQAVQPRKVICVGKNYAAHIEEMASVPAEDMVVFMKPAISIGSELIAVMDEPLHYEGEICLLMQGGRVAGVGFGLDLTKRETQSSIKGGWLALGAQQSVYRICAVQRVCHGTRGSLSARPGTPR